MLHKISRLERLACSHRFGQEQLRRDLSGVF